MSPEPRSDRGSLCLRSRMGRMGLRYSSLQIARAAAAELEVVALDGLRDERLDDGVPSRMLNPGVIR
jgi:hypothetical protein